VPDAGDIAWVELDPVKGTEQAGRRPALVLSDALYLAVSSRAVICPISKTARNWPFDVPLLATLRTEGVVMVDQIRTIHRPSRLFEVVEGVPRDLLDNVREVLAALLGMELSPAVKEEGE
jgi:mRNA interferase MazF